MRKFLKFTGSIALVIVLSCVHEKGNQNIVTSIDIEGNINKMEIVNLSTLAKKIRYVPLENIDNVPLNDYLPYIDVTNNHILVTSSDLCLLYDIDGHFISKIGSRGRGLGEYQYITNLQIGSNNRIFISDIYDLFEYNLDGTYINKYANSIRINNKDEEYIRSWLIIYDSLFFGHLPNTTGIIENKAVIINKYGAIKQSFKNYSFFESKHTIASGFEDHAHIYHFENKVFYKEFFNDTLFSLNYKNELVPYYILRLGKLKMPDQDRAKFPHEVFPNRLFIWDVFQVREYILLNCDFENRFPAKRLTPITLVPGTDPVWYNTKHVLGLYNKKTRKMLFCRPTSSDNPLFTSGIFNDIDAGPRFFPVKQINDSTLLMWVTAKNLKDHVSSDDFKKSSPKYPDRKKELEVLANRLTDLDNPVLMFVTFKK